jgi:succinate dehydrogenase/fumarate reductase flavoprotein subunit
MSADGKGKRSADGISGIDALRPEETNTLVIGGGIAGIWSALSLIENGVPTTLITYQGQDRGGRLGSSRRSTGTINTLPMEHPDFESYLDTMSHFQVNPSIGGHLQNGLREELARLEQFVPFKKLKIGLAPACSSEELLSALLQAYTDRGGKVIDGWVTRLMVSPARCEGVQYQTERGIGLLRADSIVIASGGYANLFEGSVKTGSCGSILGQYLLSGGVAANLEFIFKHGYGQPDAGMLTPTEELLGAEILDENGKNVNWLEREIYNGNGTSNHLKAAHFWRTHRDHRYYVNLSYRSLFEKTEAINRILRSNRNSPRTAVTLEKDMNSLIRDLSWENESDLKQELIVTILEGREIGYDLFARIRHLYRRASETKPVRVQQIAYFTMGGVGHIDFRTNLKNVYVNGEAMHDFGANRIGGLPWGLYLVAGRYIAKQIARRKPAAPAGFSKAECLGHLSTFDEEILEKIRSALNEYQENSFDADSATQILNWIRATRTSLIRKRSVLDDAVNWLLVGEAILTSSLCRTESRGCFLRDDLPEEDCNLNGKFTCCLFDRERDIVRARLVDGAEYNRLCCREAKEVADSTSESA